MAFIISVENGRAFVMVTVGQCHPAGRLPFVFRHENAAAVVVSTSYFSEIDDLSLEVVLGRLWTPPLCWARS